MDFRVPVTVRASILTAAAQGSETRGVSREKHIVADDARARARSHVGRLCRDNWNLRPMKTAAEAFSLLARTRRDDQFRVRDAPRCENNIFPRDNSNSIANFTIR